MATACLSRAVTFAIVVHNWLLAVLAQVPNMICQEIILLLRSIETNELAYSTVEPVTSFQ